MERIIKKMPCPKCGKEDQVFMMADSFVLESSQIKHYGAIPVHMILSVKCSGCGLKIEKGQLVFVGNYATEKAVEDFFVKVWEESRKVGKNG